MTISSPVGTVHTWRFNTTATLLDGSPISGGPFTSWTVPFHDGDIAISCYGAGGGSDSLVWYRGGGGGGIGGDAAIAAGTVLDVFPGSRGTRPSGGTAGGGMFTGGDAANGDKGGGGAPSAVLTPSGLLIIAGGGGGGAYRRGGGGGSSWAHASLTGVGSNAGVPRDTDGYITITLDYLGDWVEPSSGGWSVGMLTW